MIIYFDKESRTMLNKLIDYGFDYSRPCAGYHQDTLNNNIWVAWYNFQLLKIQDLKSEKEAQAWIRDSLMIYFESLYSEPIETKTTEDIK